jgi:uncharacterized protein (TIGR00730 family)
MEIIMRRIGIFCGSNTGAMPDYSAATVDHAHACVRRGIGIVYGGASVGLMRDLANAVSIRGGEMIGVIPEFLVELEGAQSGLTQLRLVGSMHERKALIVDLSDGFIALPGGLGHFRRVLRDLDVGPTWTSCKAVWAFERSRVLRSSSEIPRL